MAAVWFIFHGENGAFVVGFLFFGFFFESGSCFVDLKFNVLPQLGYVDMYLRIPQVICSFVRSCWNLILIHKCM
jgi:hypothetical protein